ncbi:alpha/beta fold hydrolase [Burkholderia stagnalis]
MSYEWPLDPTHLFGERYPQMLSGLPAGDVDEIRGKIISMWQDHPGGWVYEWSRLAERYARANDHYLSSLAYGWARFPVLADQPKRRAFQHQIEQYERASATFDVTFERRIVDVPYADATTAVPVHILARPGLSAEAPVLIASGGVDTWKMDLHAMFSRIALSLPYRVLAFDIPGTGESAVPLDPKAHQVITGLINIARKLGNGKVAHFGFSMGGYFSARSALSGEVDASIVIGGPVAKAFESGRSFEVGMDHIVGNAFGFDALPAHDDLMRRLSALTLRDLLDRNANSPMFVANGADDIHVPAEDTLIFNGCRNTHVSLIPGTGHCAIANRKLETVVLPAMTRWLAALELTK